MTKIMYITYITFIVSYNNIELTKLHILIAEYKGHFQRNKE